MRVDTAPATPKDNIFEASRSNGPYEGMLARVRDDHRSRSSPVTSVN